MTKRQLLDAFGRNTTQRPLVVPTQLVQAVKDLLGIVGGLRCCCLCCCPGTATSSYSYLYCTHGQPAILRQCTRSTCSCMGCVYLQSFGDADALPSFHSRLHMQSDIIDGSATAATADICQ